MTTHRRTRIALILGASVVLLGSATVALPRVLSARSGDAPEIVSIESDSTWKDDALLRRAFAQPVASAYLRGGLDRQGNPSFCGPTTAVDLLRSLGIPSNQLSILDGTGIFAPFGLVWGGLTLDEEADLLRKRTGRKVSVIRDLDLAGFRDEVRHANEPGRRYTVNFSRAPLFGRGGGHHSPIGAYLPDEDLVLVLDVNGKYGPWLVPTDRLFGAVDTVDRQSGRKRGLLRVE